MTISRPSRHAGLLAGTVILLGGGCGPSPEEALIAKNRARPKPAWVRLANFSGKTLDMNVANRMVAHDLQPNDVSGYMGFAPQEHKYVILSGGQEIASGTLEGKTTLGTTIVAYDEGGKTAFKVAVGEPREIPKGSNKLVVFDATGQAEGAEFKDENGMSIKVAKGGTSEPGEPLALDSKFTLVQNGKPVAQATLMSHNEANTAFIIPGPKIKVVIVANAPMREPLKNADFN